VESTSEIAAIWRGEMARALRSGRVLVLFVLFVMFVSLALMVVGFLSSQANGAIESKVSMATGGQAHAKDVSDQVKKQFLTTFVTDDPVMADALLALPIVLLVVFKLTLWFVPLFVALMGFDQLAGEVGPKSIRYLVVRVRRNSIILGKLANQATIFALLLSISTVLMVVIAKLLNADFGAMDVALWTFKLVASALVLALAYLALTSLCSALVPQPGVALIVNIIVLFVLWAIGVYGEAFRFPGEVDTSAMGQLGFGPSESWRAYLRYVSVWHYRHDLLHPYWHRFVTAGLIHVGFALVFVGLGQLALRRRDL
jgi:ABC-type transport system involved in multi-copper enzyme maturation permease subunit